MNALKELTTTPIGTGWKKLQFEAAAELEAKDKRIAELEKILRRAQGFIEYLAEATDADEDEIKLQKDIDTILKGKSK